MKNKALLILAAISLAVVTPNPHVQDGYVDITVNDGSPSSKYGTAPRAGIGESGEVEAGCVSNASWDLRAMAFDVNTNSLMVVSGFNPLSLNEGIGIGDVFIDINNPFTVPNRPSRSNGYLTYSNSAVGYEYAIDLISPSNGGLGCNIVALSAEPRPCSPESMPRTRSAIRQRSWQAAPTTSSPAACSP